MRASVVMASGLAGIEKSPASGVDGQVVDAAMLFTGIVIALATVWLQWVHFKKTHPTLAATARPEGQSGYLRWRGLYWREMRATAGLALISLCMVGLTLFFYREVTPLSLTSVVFWLGMFFYNLWLGQWYSWRISTKRRR